MLPWHQRTSRRANSSMVGGFSSQLPRSTGQHAHLVAGAAHQGGLDLVVGEHVAAERRFARQHRQVALLVERLDAHQRVVAPERPAVAHPPGLAHGVGAHAVAHAELEDARERAGRRHADHQALQDADLGVRLHHAHQAHDLVARHQAVGVERQHQRVVLAPAGAEVAHVAGLVAGVVGAAAVDDAVAIGIGGLPGFDGASSAAATAGSLVSLSTK